MNFLSHTPFPEKLTSAFIISSEKCLSGETLFVKRVSPEPLSEKLKNSFPYNIEALLPNEADALRYLTGAAGRAERHYA